MSLPAFSFPRAARLVALAVILPGLVVSLSGGCGPTECVREVRCLDKCGGTIVQDGCDPCPEGTVDRDDCDADAGDGG